MTESKLSPAAQAVRSAAGWQGTSLEREAQNIAAAALRAAALEVHAEEIVTCGGASYALVVEVDDLLAIAAELEASS